MQLNKMFLIIFLIFFTTNIAFSEEDAGLILDESGQKILNEDGHPINSEYVETCRNLNTGKFIKCPKNGENNGFISIKIQRRCRDSQTGRFVKCPKS